MANLVGKPAPRRDAFIAINWAMYNGTADCAIIPMVKEGNIIIIIRATRVNGFSKQEETTPADLQGIKGGRKSHNKGEEGQREEIGKEGRPQRRYNNTRQNFRFRTVRRCYLCGIPGHLSYQCRNSESSNNYNDSQQYQRRHGNVRVEVANAVFNNRETYGNRRHTQRSSDRYQSPRERHEDFRRSTNGYESMDEQVSLRGEEDCEQMTFAENFIGDVNNEESENFL